MRVTTARGEYEAGQLVICAGPWVGNVLSDLNLPFQLERQVQLWFQPDGGIEPFRPGSFPVWLWETRDGDYPYGLPALDGPEGGIKVAIHHGGADRFCSLDNVKREVAEAEITATRAMMMSRLPALRGRC